MKKILILALSAISCISQAKILEVNPNSISILPIYSTKALGNPAIVIGIAKLDGTSELYEIQQQIYRVGGEVDVLEAAKSRVNLTNLLIQTAIQTDKNIIINTEEIGMAAIKIAP